jgi:hypothetical protein
MSILSGLGAGRGAAHLNEGLRHSGTHGQRGGSCLGAVRAARRGCVSGGAAACYFIRSLIFASAARAHSSSSWPPGAPLTPIAPIAAPLAMMVTPPTA